jgi:hypothetical protein
MWDTSVFIDVTNSLAQPIHLELLAYSKTIDLGEIDAGGECKRTFDNRDIGEGPATLRVNIADRQVDYDVGIFLTDNGPFERYINLTPKGTVVFFYACSKGSWCGFLEPTSDVRETGSASTQGVATPPSIPSRG